MMEREYRDLAFVPRWSIIRTIKDQSVAEHSFYVALYAEQLARYFDWKGDVGILLTMALRHDLEECFTGDIPGPVKSHFIDKDRYHDYTCKQLNVRYNLHTRVIQPHEEEEMTGIIKIADELDALFYLAGEMQMGNESVSAVFQSRMGAFRNKFLHILTHILKRSDEEAVSKWSAMQNAIGNHRYIHSRVVEPYDVELK